MSLEREPNRVIRDYIEQGGPSEWAHKEVAQSLYEWADVFRFYFFGAQREDQQGLPQPLIAVAPLRVDTLAAYRLVPNPNGLPYEITLNSRYLDRPQWETLETLLHEMVHLYQENTPGLIPCKHGYHNIQFISICEELGLHPRLGSGAHSRPADGQFARLMERNEVEPPDYAVVVPPENGKRYWWDEDRGAKSGKSTLVLYTSESCVRKPPCKVRSGRPDLQLRCETCGGAFSPQI